MPQGNSDTDARLCGEPNLSTEETFLIYFPSDSAPNTNNIIYGT